MNRILTYNFSENFVERLADLLKENYFKKDKDLSRLAVVFGGKRPALFLKRALSHRVKESFFPPQFFTIDEFVNYVLFKKEHFSLITDLDACYVIFKLAKRVSPQILKGRHTFAEFLPWAREILAFIEQLDLEAMESSALKNIELSAEIGYAVPPDINRLLEHIIILRARFHETLEEQKTYTRGLCYLKAAREIATIVFEDFDEIIFGNFFFLHKTESLLLKDLLKRQQALLIFQGSEDDWPVLKKNANAFLNPILPEQKKPLPRFNLELFAGFDTHSQVCLVREIIKKIIASGESLNGTVIVLPESGHLIPLLSEITALVEDFNISMGYPLERSSLQTLLKFIFSAQLTRKEKAYYAKDYLKVLRHPLVKSLKLSKDPAVTRVLIHKIEEVLTGQQKTILGGQLFLKLEDLIDLDHLYEITREVLARMGFSLKKKEIKEILEELHAQLFTAWEKIINLSNFSQGLEGFLNLFVHKSLMGAYPLNLKIAERMYSVVEEMKSAVFNQESFFPEECFQIFKNKIEREMVSFLGSPLKGLQILGLLETRALNFKNVIIMDMNEGVLPRLRIYDPLIPREVMVSLNLDRLEQEEEIQRYQFMRLISSAENVYLVYEESQDKEKSRFVEELVWARQKKENTLDAVKITRAEFKFQVLQKKTDIKKTGEVLDFLKNHTYSASSLNTYIRCPLRFYYKYVLGLMEKEDYFEEPENRQVGIFIHELLEETFGKFLHKKPVLGTAFRTYFFKVFETKFEETFGRSIVSDAFLLKKVLEVRLDDFLNKEGEAKGVRDVQEILEIEKRFAESISLSSGEFKFVYQVDRIDRLKDGTILIVDYKTGSEDPTPKKMETISSMELSRDAIKKNVRSFQMPLYFDLLGRRYPNEKINAMFYNLRTLETKEFLKDAVSSDAREPNQVFRKSLEHTLGEIVDPKVHFKPDDREPRYCATCPFYYVCR